jgi:branched-subunit amino acid ABC-type transport system permease component
MTYTLVIPIEVVRAAAGLVLISLGLAIIFSMMRVINIAHGEFMMLGCCRRGKRLVGKRAPRPASSTANR